MGWKFEKNQADESTWWKGRHSGWLVPHNHNHLRLSRILASVRLLGLPEYCAALFDCLDGIYKARPDAISAVTFGYWQRAARG